MRLFVDLDTNAIIVSPGVAQPVTELIMKRSPYVGVNVQFTRNGTVIELPNDATGVFGLKQVGKYDDNYVTAGLAWAKTGTGENTVYSFVFTLITAPLDALFFVDANINNDAESIQLMAELQWTTSGTAYKTPTVRVIVHNDVIRGGETAPSLPSILYAVFLPEITGLVGGTPTDLDSIPTVGMQTGVIIEVLIPYSGELQWLTFVLRPVAAGPGVVEPLDYNGTTNDRRWHGALGPAGPQGQGVPPGGTTGQVLVKLSNDDYDTGWIDNTTDPNILTEDGVVITGDDDLPLEAE